MSKWDEVVDFHGHACPGLAKGFIMTKAAMARLGVEHAHDEELVAIVENKSCAVDAVQVVAGCTFGKGNFVFCDFGKQVITLARRNDNKAVRVAMRSKVSKQGLAADLSRDEYIDLILKTPPEEIMNITEVDIEIPPPAEVYETLVCTSCLEGVMRPLATIVDEQVYCLPCWLKIRDEQSGMA